MCVFSTLRQGGAPITGQENFLNLQANSMPIEFMQITKISFVVGMQSLRIHDIHITGQRNRLGLLR